MSERLPPPDAPSRDLARRRLAAGIALATAVLAAYHGYVPGAFFFDDFGSVVENPTIRQLWPPAWLTPPEGAGVGGRPFANFTLALDYAAGGLAPGRFRSTNLALHLAVALALFGVVRRTLRSWAPGGGPGGSAAATALVVATLWAVHPLTSGTVGYVSQRTEQLMAWCGLATLYSFIRYTETRTRCWAAAAVGACLLGQASKEVMVVIPVLVWLYDRTFVAGSFAAAWQRHRRLHLALAGTWVLLGGLMATSGLAQRGVGLNGAIGVADYALIQSGAVLRYLQLALWPHPLVFDYGWVSPPSAAAAVFTLAGCGLLVAGTGLALRRWPAAGFAGAWVLLLLAPTSSVVPILQQPVAENRMYLPLAGVIAGAVVGLQRSGRLRPSFLFAGGLIAALVLGVITARRAAIFGSELAVWRDTVRQRPASARAHAQLGAALLRADQVEASLTASTTALQLRPHYADARVNLGVALARRGDPARAIPHYEEALRTDPAHREAHYNLGLALAATGRADAAVAEFEAALRLQPGQPQAHNNLAVVLLTLGRAAESATHARTALALDPAFAEAHYNLGNALARLGETAAAAAAFESALRLKPDFARAHHNLGVLELRAGHPAAARARFEAALRAQPDYPEARRSLEAITPR